MIAVTEAPGASPPPPSTPSIDDRLESLRLAVCSGHPRSWSERLKNIRDQAAKSGFVWESRHEALFQAIVERGVLNDLEGVKTAPDARSAARRLKALESHTQLYGVTVLSDRIADLRRQNQFAQAGFDLEEGKSHALESLQDAGDRKWSGAYTSAGETMDKVADSTGHLLRGAAMTLGIFE
jgi:hypothetical protein